LTILADVEVNSAGRADRPKFNRVAHRVGLFTLPAHGAILREKSKTS
jgi:hypothetical protein